MTEFSFGKGRKLFTHIKRHRYDIEGENNFDCLEAYGIQEPNIELPSDFNEWELQEVTSLEAIPTDFENSNIIPSDDEEKMWLYSLIHLVFLYAEPKCCKEIINGINNFYISYLI